MTRRSRSRLIYSILTVIFITLAIVNFIQVVYLNPYGTDENIWLYNSERKQITINQIKPGGVSEQAGLQNGDILESIEGKHFESLEEAQKFVNRYTVGDKLSYTIKRGNQTITTILSLAKSDIMLPILSNIVGLLFLLIGFLVVVKKPYMRTPRLFYYFCLMFFIIISLGYATHLQPWSSVLRYIFIAGMILWGPSILHFFMNFPIRVPLLHRRPKSIFLIYLPSILIVTYVLLLNHRMSILIIASTTLYILIALYVLYRSKKKITNPHERKSLRLITWGMILGLTPLGIISFMTEMIVLTFGLNTVHVVYGFMALVPIAFGYAIMRYGLMDVEIIIKKSLSYSLLTSLFVLLYFILVVGLGGFFMKKFGMTGEATKILFIGIVALIFQPLRNSVQGIVDRYFYRERYQYQKALLRLSQELPGLVNVQEILQRVSDTITNAMHVANVVIHLYDRETHQYLPRLTVSSEKQPDLGWQEETDGLIDIIKREKQCCLFYKIEEDERYNNLPFIDKVKIEKYGILLSVPMFYQDALIGFISLGQKRSGQVYNQEDMDLLQTVAGNTAIALVNARLHQEDLRKQRFEDELILARHIQSGLLPKTDPQYPDLEIAGISQSATLVGGDYYDYIPVAKNRLFIFVGDVSGKGMPAALYMSKVQGMIHVAAGIYNSPKKIMVDINHHLYTGMERKYFVTMLASVVDIQQRKITVCRAGHMPILIKRKNTVEHLRGSGIGLGLEAGEIFTREIDELQVKLKKGDFCLFYSDGLVEAMNSTKEMFGEERLEQLLADGGFQSAAELRELLLNQVKAFQAGEAQNDDITFVVIRAK